MLEDLLTKLDVSRSKTTTSGFVISAVLIAVGTGWCKGVDITVKSGWNFLELIWIPL